MSLAGFTAPPKPTPQARSRDGYASPTECSLWISMTGDVRIQPDIQCLCIPVAMGVAERQCDIQTDWKYYRLDSACGHFVANHAMKDQGRCRQRRRSARPSRASFVTSSCGARLGRIGEFGYNKPDVHVTFFLEDHVPKIRATGGFTVFCC